MINSFTVTNYLGDSINLNLREPEKSGFVIKSVSGLGPSKANINTTESSTNDGSLFNSARLTQRNIIFELVFMESANESIEDVRQKSYKYFPVKKNIELLIESDNRIVKTVGYVESNEPNIFSIQEGSQISIVCPDPYFYSAGVEGDNVTVFYGIEPAFKFPFSATSGGLSFGNIQNKTENVVTYLGDSEVGIVIHIHAMGDVSNVVIYNVRTRERMAINTVKIKTLTGHGIIKGDDVIVNTLKGKKSITLIRAGESINILNCLDKNTDWFRLVKGDNIFAFTAETGVTNLQFRMENKVIYEGV